MFLTSITLCCFILNVQSQNPFYSPLLNPDQIYFPGNFPQVVPLSLPPPIDKEAIRRIFEDEPQKNKKENTSVEIERSNELASGTIVERVDKNDKLNLISRESTPVTPSSERAYQITQGRQPVVQNTLPRRDIAFQIGHNGQPIVQNTLASGVTSQQLAQYRQPIVQNTLPSRETAYQIPQDRQPGELNTLPPPPSNAGGFNSLLYSVTNFGVHLLKNVNAGQPGNVVLSPYSITSLLALLQQGSWGQTQEQITNTLQMTSQQSASAYAQITDDFKSRNSRNILRTANILFVADAFNINTDFKEVAINSFKSDITPVSFARPDLAARQINSWVSSRTDNKIDRLISPDSLDESTQIVLVNAIYFKGLWEVPFRVESTVPRDFHLDNGQTKTAQFMRMRKLFKTGMDPTTNAKVIMLPFEGEQYSLMVILPSQLVGLRSTLSSLTDARLLSYLSFSAKETELELPKFTARADINLAPVFRNMGITNMFGQYAELNGIGTYRSFSPKISSAVHSAVISIDEKGGTASAATAFAAVALSYDEASVLFKADRPFLAILWDDKNSLPLFMAKIDDPQY